MLTNEDAVRRVIKTSLTTEQVGAFIEDASLWVTEELSDEGLSDDRTELITRYLTCALIRMRDLGVKSATWKEVTETYQVDLYVTEYLTRAAAFDPTGKLRETFMPDKARPRLKFRTGQGFAAEAQESS